MKTYSRKELYALGEALGESATARKVGGGLILGGGGSGGGGSTQSTSKVENTNIPEYAKGYVENMLGATQNQLFNTTKTETGKDESGNPIYNTTIDSFKPYQAYGGTYDDKGNQLSYDPSKGIAGINDMQRNAYAGMANTAAPTAGYNLANAAIEDAGRGAGISATHAYNYGTMGNAAGQTGQQIGIQSGGNYGQQGQDYGTAGARLGIQAGANYGQQGMDAGLAGGRIGAAAQQDALNRANSAALVAGNYGQQGQDYGNAGASVGMQGGAQYGNMGANAGNLSAQIGQMGLQAQQTGQQIGNQAQNYAAQAAGAGQQYANQATNPNAMQSYMSPYMQNVVDVQNREAARNSAIQGTQEQAQAAKAGAFGGSRDAIMRAERARNLATLQNQNQAQGLQSAYQQAQQAQQFGAGLGLQGLSGAQQGLGTALQGGQLGLSGIGTALQGQQGAMQGAGVGLQGVNAQLAGTAQGMQGSQIGLSAVDRQLAAGQLAQQGANTGLAGTGQIMQGAQVGLSGVDRQLAGTAQGMEGSKVGLAGVDRQLAGTAQGMQGSQIGLQGVNAAQAGYGLLGQQGMNLNNSLSQQQQNNINLNNAKMTMGNQEMAYQQSIKNQAVQDYANAQQYPLMQLGTMSNMLRGLPMQASTTNQYQASPNPLSQVIGTAGAGANIYNAMKPAGAAGGLPSEFKYAKGGIMSYDMGGEVESQLESMDEKGLAAQARESSSPSIRKIAQRLLRERQMSRQPQSPDAANVQYQAAGVPSYKPGGIIAFAKGDEVPNPNPGLENNVYAGETPRGIVGATETPRTRGIAGVNPDVNPGHDNVYAVQAPPVAQAAPAPVAQAAPADAPAGPSPDIMQEATRQRDIYSKQANRPTAEILKEIQTEREALGAGDNKARDEYRSQQMAERANMKDEQERQRSLRLASFFAQWGSTPGPVLVAGMSALKNSIPDIIADEKDAKKARREADKIIYDIDEATRLEKLGMIDKATALKEKAAGHAQDFNKQLLVFQSQANTDARAKEVAEIHERAAGNTAEKHLEGVKYSADAHKGAQGDANAQRAEELRFANIDRALQIARGNYEQVAKNIEDAKNKPPKNSPLAKAMESITRYNVDLGRAGGDPSKVDKYIAASAQEAKTVLDKFEATAKQRLADARAPVQMYENIFTNQGRGTKLEKTATPNPDDPLGLGDLLKEAPPAKAAAPASEPAKPVIKPPRALAEVPTNSLPSNPYLQVSRGRRAIDQAALQEDLKEYNSLKDSKLSLAAGRRLVLEKKLRAAGALED
jgi:hypothetical protein